MKTRIKSNKQICRVQLKLFYIDTQFYQFDSIVIADCYTQIEQILTTS